MLALDPLGIMTVRRLQVNAEQGRSFARVWACGSAHLRGPCMRSNQFALNGPSSVEDQFVVGLWYTALAPIAPFDGFKRPQQYQLRNPHPLFCVHSLTSHPCLDG